MCTLRRVSYADFRQACRAYRPSELLPFLAWHSTGRHGAGRLEIEKLRTTPPWVTATIARESLLWGNEYRARPLTERTLPYLFNLARDTAQAPEDSSLARLLTPLMHDQFMYSQNPIIEMSRAVALLGTGWQGYPDLDWSPVFGMDLAHMMRATNLLMLLATAGRGRVNLSELYEVSNDIEQHFIPESEAQLALHYLTRTPAEHKAEARSAGVLDASAGQYAYNPLRTAPFVDFGLPVGIIAPEPRLVWQTLSVANLYYLGPKLFGPGFHTALGDRFSSYIGRQLSQIEGAEVFPEIPYSAQNAMTIDWFVVLTDLVIMVECKSARLYAAALAGNEDEIAKTTLQHLTKGRDQLDRTASLIQAGEPRLSKVPTDRPLVGLVVTAEPIHLANSGIEPYGEPSIIPSMTASAAEIEGLVTLPGPEVSRRLQAALGDPERRTWSLINAIGSDGMDLKRNFLLSETQERAKFSHD